MTEATESNGVGHNSGVASALSDDQLRALAFHHKGIYARELAAKKAADASLKNAAKKALADGIPVDRIKQMIRLEEAGGEAALRAEIEQQLQVARWMGAEVGTQFSFIDEPDRTPLEERAYEGGKVSGMKGETCRTPEGYSGKVEQAFVRGWHDGQAALASALELTSAVREATDAEGDDEAEEAESAPPRKRGRPAKSAKNGAAKNGSGAAGMDAVKDALNAELAEGEAALTRPFDKSSDPFPTAA